MQVQAITKNIPMSAQKMREVTPRKGARVVAQTLKSALANAEELARQGKFAAVKPEVLVVREAVAQTGTTFKRFTPKARGSAGPILKRRCHVKIILSDE